MRMLASWLQVSKQRSRSCKASWRGQTCFTVKTRQYSVHRAMAFSKSLSQMSKARSQMPRKRGWQEAPGSPPTSALDEYEMRTPDLLFQPMYLSYLLTNQHLLGLDAPVEISKLALSRLLNPIPCHCCIPRGPRLWWTRKAVHSLSRSLLLLRCSMADA